MRKFLIVLLIQFSFLQVYSQTEQDVISEANRLEISSRQEAINALANRGVSEVQAREMAQLRGIDFDTFLENYLKTKTSAPNTIVANTNSNDVVSELKVVSLTPIAASPLKDPAVT
ncbi:MAG: hypothetical protein QMB29_02210, partial [Urechidicola sp.]